MAKKGGTETVRQNLDPQSQAYVNRMRLAAQTGYSQVAGGGSLFEGPDGRPISEQVAPYFNMFQSGVIDPTRAEFDYLRGGARRDTTDAAIRSGAYGGSRHGVAEGVRMAGLDRAQASTIAGLNAQGYDSAMQYGLPHLEQQRMLRERMRQEPMYRHQQGLGMLNMGMGPTGMTQSTETQQGWGPQLAGLGLMGASMFFPPAAAGAAALSQRNSAPFSGFQRYGQGGGIQHYNLNPLYS